MFSGAITAMVTPFDKGEVDEKRLRENVEFQITNGINGLVPCGTTGESPTLSHEEHDKVIEIVVDATAGRVPVIAGTGSNSTDEALRLTKHAKEAGASASLQVLPYYNKPTQEGMYRHFMSIADKVDLPMVLYNIPGRCGVELSCQTIVRLAGHKNVVAVKEATGSLNNASAIASSCDLAILSGDDSLTIPMMSVGAGGVISVLSNLIPERVQKMVDSALAGDFTAARASHLELFELFNGMFIETNPITVKTAMMLAGMDTGQVRLPLCEMEAGNKQTLEALLRKYKIIK